MLLPICIPINEKEKRIGAGVENPGGHAIATLPHEMQPQHPKEPCNSDQEFPQLACGYQLWSIDRSPKLVNAQDRLRQGAGQNLQNLQRLREFQPEKTHPDRCQSMENVNEADGLPAQNSDKCNQHFTVFGEIEEI